MKGETRRKIGNPHRFATHFSPPQKAPLWCKCARSSALSLHLEVGESLQLTPAKSRDDRTAPYGTMNEYRRHATFSRIFLREEMVTW